MPDFKKMFFPDGGEPPREQVLKLSLQVPQEARQYFIEM